MRIHWSQIWCHINPLISLKEMFPVNTTKVIIPQRPSENWLNFSQVILEMRILLILLIEFHTLKKFSFPTRQCLLRLLQWQLSRMYRSILMWLCLLRFLKHDVVNLFISQILGSNWLLSFMLHRGGNFVIRGLWSNICSWRRTRRLLEHIEF